MRTDGADPRIVPYLRHLEAEGPGVPWISTSHKTLGDLYRAHGASVIDSLLREHWDRVRTAGPVHFG